MCERRLKGLGQMSEKATILEPEPYSGLGVPDESCDPGIWRPKKLLGDGLPGLARCPSYHGFDIVVSFLKCPWLFL